MSMVALPNTPAGLKNIGRLQDIPAVRQLLTLAVVAAAIALGLWLFFWTQKPDYTALAGLDAKSAAEAGDLLRSAQVPYKVDPSSGSLMVPVDRVGEAKMALASAGLGSGERGGFEMMQGDQGFGTSQLVENARYQHALEIELARTISNLRPVREARVHLALPKPSAFTRQKEPASASVVLQLNAGAALEAGQVDAIEHLVASSIPGLPADKVTVLDQFGRLLSNPDPSSDAAIGALQFDQQRRQEALIVQRVQQLLEPMTGPGRVSAQVSVDMDFDQTEQASEQYGDPARVRSEQVSESGRLAAQPSAAQGVPGSASNTPDAATNQASADSPAPSASQRDGEAGEFNGSRSSVRNYELDRTLTHTRQAPSRVRRITAAVLVDNVASSPAKGGKTSDRPLTAEELQRIESLVQQAIGFDSKRGDVVTVVNTPFARTSIEEPAGAPFWENPQMRDLLRTLLGGLALLLVVWFVLRPSFRALTTPRVAATAEPDVLAADQEVAVVLSQTPPRAVGASFDEKLTVARSAVGNDSKRVAAVMRDWVNADG